MLRFSFESAFAYSKNKPILLKDSLGLKEDCDCKDPPRPPPNGCGPSWFKVDDAPGGSDFSPCCNAHDICYATCRGPSRDQCDSGMTACMVNVCKKRRAAGFDKYLSCVNQALKYIGAIKNFAGLAFYLARKDCCQ